MECEWECKNSMLQSHGKNQTCYGEKTDQKYYPSVSTDTYTRKYNYSKRARIMFATKVSKTIQKKTRDNSDSTPYTLAINI